MAQFTTFTIAGTNVRPFVRDGSLRVSHKGNGRDICRFTLEHKDPNALLVFRAAKRDAVVIEIDGDEEFTGIVWEFENEKIFEQRGYIRQIVTCLNRAALLDVVYINAPHAADNIGDMLVTPIANMAPHGVTLSGSQLPGPVLGAQNWDFMTIRAVADKLQTESLWVWRVDNTEFIMLEPGTEAAPFIVGQSVPGSYRTIKFKDTLTGYYSEGWLRYGAHGLQVLTQVFEGDGVATEYQLDEVLVLLGTAAAPQVTPSGNVTVERTGPTITEESIGVGSGTWEYEVRASTDNVIVNTGAVLGAGEFVTISYQWMGPGAVFARDIGQYLLYGPWTKVIDMPGIANRTAAIATLNGLLQQFIGDKMTATIFTQMPGLKPFQVLTIEIDDHLVANDFLILETELSQITHDAGLNHVLEWKVTAVKGNIWRGNWTEFWLTQADRFGTGGTQPVEPAPTVPDQPMIRDTAQGRTTSNTTSHAITLPTHLAGDLLVVVFASDGSSTVSIDGSSTTGWASIAAGLGATSLVRGTVFSIEAPDGATTLTLTTSGAEQSSWIVYSIFAGSFSGVDASTSTGGGFNSDPPNHVPSPGGTPNYLWIVTRCGDSEFVASAPPSSFGSMLTEAGTVSGASTNTATLVSGVSSLNPGAWTSGDLVSWVCHTIAVWP